MADAPAPVPDQATEAPQAAAPGATVGEFLPADPNPQNEFDDDSGYSEASDAGSTYTASLASSIRNYRSENGRTYHAFREGVYAIPNDEIELDRLDLQHHLWELSMNGRLYQAPVQNMHNCLDVGAGTGIWAIDFAEEHPETQVTGIDLSPSQPDHVPPNLQFIVDDAEDSWHYRQKFDFIHERMMVGSFNDWAGFCSNALEWLVPGGWVELQDVETLYCDDDSFTLEPPSCDLARWWSTSCKGFDAAGRKMDTSMHHAQRLRDAGFVDVQEKIYKWPTNTWPKDKKMKQIGVWSRENTIQALEGLSMAPLTRFLGWSPDEVKVLCAGARADIRNTNIHAYWALRVVWGRKPDTA
ncbi:MAG: hypothetical protein M1820_007372 [Bogoriella megaspora]|nr:MAG: hypothetical protein M1820_007372 [Bogoriella megaspora]